MGVHAISHGLTEEAMVDFPRIANLQYKIHTLIWKISRNFETSGKMKTGKLENINVIKKKICTKTDLCNQRKFNTAITGVQHTYRKIL